MLEANQLGTVYPVAYTAKNFESGLSDVFVDIYTPSYSHIGQAPMVEKLPGIYVYDFSTSPTDQEGFYYFLTNSISHPRLFAHRVKFFRSVDDRYYLYPIGDNIWAASFTVHPGVTFFENNSLVDADSVNLQQIIRLSDDIDVTSEFNFIINHTGTGTYLADIQVPPGTTPGFYKLLWLASYNSVAITEEVVINIFDAQTGLPGTSVPTAEIYGFVYDGEGNPVENIEVKFHILDSRVPSDHNIIIANRQLVSYTDANGRFTFSTYRNVNFELYVDAADFAGRGKTLDGAQTQIADIVLPNLI